MHEWEDSGERDSRYGRRTVWRCVRCGTRRFMRDQRLPCVPLAERPPTYLDLEARVATLEAENARLRAYLSEVIQTIHNVEHSRFRGDRWQMCEQAGCRDARAAMEKPETA